MAGEPALPQGLTEDQRQWIHWRMDWLCENFGEGLLENAKVAIPNGNQFAKIYSTQSIAPAESAELALDYLKRLCHRLDCDSSQYHLDVSNDPQRWSSPNEIAIDSAALSNRPNLLALLAHELSFAQLLEHTELTQKTDDIEGLADLTGVFFGLGIILAGAIVGDEEDGVAYFEVCLSPAMLGYSLALFAEMRGESKPAWAGELRGAVLEGFYDSQYYLEQTEEERSAVENESEDSEEYYSEETIDSQETAQLGDDRDTAEAVGGEDVNFASDEKSNLEEDVHGSDVSEPEESFESEHNGAYFVDQEAVDRSGERGSPNETRPQPARNSGIGKEKCPECGRLKAPESQLCRLCLETHVDPKAALREELANHDDADYLWLQFGLILMLAVLALTAFSYL